MAKRHTVPQHYIITVYNDMFDHMDRMMGAFAKKKSHWKAQLLFAVKFARQKLSKYYAEMTPTTGIQRISVHRLNPYWKLQSFTQWGKGTDINPEDETSYSTQYHEACMMYVENEYYAKH
jgi:hypothetical protein